MLEAMSAGCALVLSDTEPVREFADADAAHARRPAPPSTIADAVLATLADPGAAEKRRTRARAIIEDTLSTRRLYPEKAELFRSLVR